MRGHILLRRHGAESSIQVCHACRAPTGRQGGKLVTAEAAHLCSQLKVLAPLGLAVQGAVGAVLRLLPGFSCMPGTR